MDLSILYFTVIFSIYSSYSISIDKRIENILLSNNRKQFNMNGKVLKSLSNDLDKYFDQRLDHFEKSNNQKWQQRYWINKEYFKDTGPIFLYIEGEGIGSSVPLYYGIVSDFAKLAQALIVSLEHRYYGKSWPTSNLSTENLKYLNINQALADLAHFRDFIHHSMKLNENHKWVSFGVSYPGVLSAMLRLRYPSKIHSAFSSSAPIRLKLNMFDYLNMIDNSLKNYDPRCPAVIKEAMDSLQEKLKTDKGRLEVKQLFNLCDSFFMNSTDDSAILQFYIQNTFKDPVQNSFDKISDCCYPLTDPFETDSLMKLAKLWNSSLDGAFCFTYNDLLEYYKQVEIDQTGHGYLRQWMYQTCFELGYHQSTDSAQQPFGSAVTIQFLLKMCSDIFGVQFDDNKLAEQINKINLDNGNATTSFKATRVVFTNGQFDPWSSLSYMYQPPNNESKVVFIYGARHGDDLLGLDEELQTKNVYDAVLRIIHIITEWLKID